MGPAALIESLRTPARRADPYPVYEALRAGGPVCQVDAQTYAVLGHAAADQVLRDARCRVDDAAFLDANWPGWRDSAALLRITESMLFTNPPTHERVRRAASRAFTARRVAALREPVERLVADLADRMAGRADATGTTDFMAEFAYLLPVTVIAELLGVPRGDLEWFRPRAADLVQVLEFMIDVESLGPADAATVELREYFAGLVAARRRSPADDLTSALIAQRDPLSGDELLANLVLLLVAGFETTTNLLGNGLAILLERPDQAARLRAAPGTVAGYVTEMLRFDAPVQLTARRAVEPIELAGLPVPSGADLLVLLGAANRDPDRYASPGVFDPDRSDGAPLSFGGGIHYCLGSALARLEAEVAFPALVRRFPRLSTAGAGAWRDRLTLRGYATLPVRLG